MKSESDPGITGHQQTPPQPDGRHEFGVAILCALPHEASAVHALFDHEYDAQMYGKSPNDRNTYSTGIIGGHNVVLVHMPNMGIAAAATAAAYLHTSFEGIRLALVVGICGGAPQGGDSPSREILLGDIVFSDGLIQYRFGRQYPHNRFLRKETPRDILPRPGNELRAVLAKLKTSQGREWLARTTGSIFCELRETLRDGLRHPGAALDCLFDSHYMHKHPKGSDCQLCAKDGERYDICELAAESSCVQLGCHPAKQIQRQRQHVDFQPDIHFGLIASGDTVMKSGSDRDAISGRDKVIAFEMEGAGVWETCTNTLVIKGVCDYADSHKCRTWQRYAAFTAAAATKAFLRMWSPGSSSSARFEGRTMWCDRVLDILRKLDQSPYQDRKERNPERVLGTCEWFVRHALFQRWKESKQACMLWVSADPGCGKSVLAKYLVDSVLVSTQTRTTCYYFFKDDFPDQRSVTCALCCLLRQILLQNETLFSQRLVERNPRAGEIVCVLDAFDECEPSGRVQLAQALCKLYNAPKNINLKFLITSRPYGEIRRGFQPLECPGLPVIHLSGENDVESRQIATEIGLYVRARVKRMREKLKLSIPEERLLLKELLKVPNRTYLWVRLTIDVIERDIDIDKTGIKAAISCLPETVDEAYEKILRRCRDPRKAKRIFHIMVATTRPLTVKEMDVALAVTASHKKHGDLELKQEDRLHAIIREMCGLFVTVIDGHVYFLHETSRTFLVKPKGTKTNGRACENVSWKHSIILHDAHYLVTQICSTYLLLEEFGKSNALRHTSAERYAFLDYAATFWTLHARQALTVDSSLLLSMLQLIDVQSQCFKTWTRIYFSRGDDRCLLKVDSLIIAAYFGLCPLVPSLLSRGDTDIERVDLCYGRSALHWAAVNGHIEVTKHLVLRPRYKFMERIRIGHLMHLRDAQGRTPLMNAVVNGHVEIAKILLRLGSENGIRDALGRTSAEYAVLNKNKQMISMLKEHGLKINTTEEVLTFTDVDRHELLRMAARYGHTEVVIALLRNTSDSQIETWLKELLWIATQRDHEDVMKALLERIPENTQMSTRRYRLVKSSDRCLDQVIMMLLKDGLDNMIPLDENQNPLMTTAAGRGYDNVVMSLISKSKQHEVTDALPLCLAAMCGQIKTVELLLKHVHPSNIAEFAGRALRTTSAASQESQIAIAKILIRGGADINHQLYERNKETSSSSFSTAAPILTQKGL
ncbi:hypothetical protein AbraIFM66951_005126 [Aspergillus brasiliensis]|uniref:Nucleoside phosphorylase domain-containing protein n=1 Tax=Aspergillus brasiliensis TaxID=319629 RepID=A0A9W5YW10_9EURO|nr:hypothetical protein AbraCBS73388_011848 [Aspergillus brasiliensis]GKZ51190.1 hypothetical protein AbraIFM66951_005126 [Aspergillus brasiliensis]